MLDSNVIVIKYGGSLLEDPQHRKTFLAEITALSKTGKKIVLVHGGGKEITRELERRGIPARFVNGLRVTDEATMQVVEEVLARVNREIVEELKNTGTRADGYSGRTDHVLQADPLPELGRVGKPKPANIASLGNILRKASLPVFYSVAEDSAGHSLNINADDFAQALAIACRAQRLVFLTDAGALLDKSGKPIPQIHYEGVEKRIQDGTITGGMIVKVRACADAIKQGVGRVDICKNIHGLTTAQEQSPEGTSFVL